MTWEEMLLTTYGSLAGRPDGPVPMGHMMKRAHVEVELSADGRFIHAGEACEDTLIPVTEASRGRTSNCAPHPLCDELRYIAGDFRLLCGSAEEAEDAGRRHGAYMAGLNAWADSGFSHPKVLAIRAYLAGGTLAEDLMRSGLVRQGTGGAPGSCRIGGQPCAKAFVRFRVLGGAAGTSGTWQDPSLIEAYSRYFESGLPGRRDVCCLLGTEAATCRSHPKGILEYAKGGKIISSNDTEGFTYRGRCHDAAEACAISQEASHEIHSALTWLAGNQGVRIGDRTFICWCPENAEPLDVLDAFDEFGLDADAGSPARDAEARRRKELRNALQGRGADPGSMGRAAWMVLEPTSVGRIAITCYGSMAGPEFLDRLAEWGRSCRWPRVTHGPQGVRTVMETPSLRRIAECAYGTEQDAPKGSRGRRRVIRADGGRIRRPMQDLFMSMLEGRRFPKDVARALYRKASLPGDYARENRELVLSTACAVAAMEAKQAAGGRKSGREEERPMKLDTENRDRSYLYGRLLAALEYAERTTYAKGEGREPSAIRLQARFAAQPLGTWRKIEAKLPPYFAKMDPGKRIWLRRLIGEITGLFREEDKKRMNAPLSEQYLMGYWMQRAALYEKKENAKKEDDDHGGNPAEQD